jgi:tRNA(fMet)-specific endonuclease VapC
MSPLLLDTNIVSILFKPHHPQRAACVELLGDHQVFISFMTRAELLLWPARGSWGERRYRDLRTHLDLYTTLYTDAETCERWVEISIRSRRAGRPMSAGDIWIAATALQWQLPLVTANHRDFDHLDDLVLIPVR